MAKSARGSLAKPPRRATSSATSRPVIDKTIKRARPSSRPPAVRLSLSVPCRAWLRRIPDAPARCRRLARAALLAGGFVAPRAIEISLVLGDDGLLRRLNDEFRAIDKPTNVLSFPALDASRPGHVAVPAGPLPVSLGDIAIAYETTAYEARAQGKTLAQHLSHLVVHGVLHLLGYDHLSKLDATVMETLEIVVLARFGIADPYRARPARTKRRAARPRPAVQSI